MSTESAVPEEQVTPETHQESQFLAVRQSYSGPLPSPDHLAGFDKVRPGLADTIISMATGEQDHRHRIEFMAALSFSAGPLLAFILGVLSIIATLILYSNGADWPVLFLAPTGFMPAALSALSRKND